MKNYYKALVVFIVGVVSFGNHAIATPDVISDYFDITGDVTLINSATKTWESSWFGTFNVVDDESMWINHEFHGWLLVDDASPPDQEYDWLLFYDQAKNWWWTTRNHDGINDLYPYIYSYSTNEYLWFDETNSYRDTNSPYQTHRKFYDSTNWFLWTDDRSHIPYYDSSNNNIWRSSVYIIKNNCYNYACNVLETGSLPFPAKPGRAGNDQWNNSMDVGDTEDCLDADELIAGKFDTDGPSNSANIAFFYREPDTDFYLPDALYFADSTCQWEYLWGDGTIPSGCTYTNDPVIINYEDADFHFLREDRNGYWSHKPGWSTSSYPTNLDRAGSSILNPQSAVFYILLYANYGCYDDEWDFSGYYHLVTDPVDGSGPADIQ